MISKFYKTDMFNYTCLGLLIIFSFKAFLIFSIESKDLQQCIIYSQNYGFNATWYIDLYVTIHEIMPKKNCSEIN